VKNALFDEVLKFSLFGRYKKKFIPSSKNSTVKGEDALLTKDPSLKLDNNPRLWNLSLFILLTLSAFFLLIGRSFELQIIKGKENFSLAEQNQIRLIRNIAERGLIKDKNNVVMVRNKPAFRLELDSTVCGRKESEWQNCIELVDNALKNSSISYNKEKILADIKLGKQSIIIALGLTKEQILPLESKLPSITGLYISTFPQRDYLFSDSSAHVLGYVGGGTLSYPSVEGKIGVEEYYNSYLTGVDGGELIQVDSSGKKVASISSTSSIPGKEVILFLDSNIQKIAYEELKKAVEEKKAIAGTVIATDPLTGGVLSMVSYPSFDPNILSVGLKQEVFEKILNDPIFPFFNRAISAVYPPASTFKMLMASAGLMEHIIDENTTIDDKGFIQVGTFIFRNWKLSGHGIVNVLRAIQVSNDTFFYSVGGGYGSIAGLGIEKIFNWATRFGFGKLSGIDINGEVKGHIPTGKDREWYLGDNYITAIGQGDVLSTPLQVNLLTAYFANGGKIMKPRIVQEIEGHSTQETVLVENLVDDHTYNLVREGLNLAVKPGGTGYPFFDFPQKYGFEVAGKTGTAEFGFGDKIKTHAWFTVFGPYAEVPNSDAKTTNPTISNVPRPTLDLLSQKIQPKKSSGSIVVTVFLEEGGSGADNAAPIARKIFDYWFSNQNPNLAR
jgi:penicillin-binding protein 2